MLCANETPDIKLWEIFLIIKSYCIFLGRETSGLDQHIHDNYQDRFILIPKTDKVRSLNLSNAAAVAVYEAMRQLDWEPMGR